MDLRVENMQRRMAETHPCPKCLISGELEAEYEKTSDTIKYFCRACKQISSNLDFYPRPSAFRRLLNLDM